MFEEFFIFISGISFKRNRIHITLFYSYHHRLNHVENTPDQCIKEGGTDSRGATPRSMVT